MAEAAQEATKPKRDLRKLFTYAYVFLNLGAMGAGATMVYFGTIGYKPPTISSEELDRELNDFRAQLQVKPMMFAMEPLSTNLDGTPRRLIKVDMSLEMLDAEGFEEIIGLGAQARDRVMRILNGKTYTDLESVQGKLHLKNEIMAQLNGILERGVVRNIYFNEFVVQ